MANQRIDFSQLGGFPLTQDALDYMQQSYQKAIIGLAQLAGDSVIVSGMIDNGTAVTDGWIVINGDLIPFKAGNKQTYFVITETGTDVQFQDDSVKTVFFTKQAFFGSGAGQIAFANLIRLDTVLKVNQNIATFNTALSAIQTAFNQHVNNQLNPHAVTKTQVGLGNLPNAKSDSTNLNDTNTLATSAAVFALANMILLTGSVYVGDIIDVNQMTVNLSKTITGNYMVLGSIRSAGTNPIYDVSVLWAVRSLSANSFTLLLRETGSWGQNVYFDYVLIKLS